MEEAPMALQRWFTRLVLPVLVAGCVGSAAKADVVTTFIGVDPSQPVDVTATKSGNTRAIQGTPAGPFNFVVIDDGGTGLGPTFRSFCADFFQDVAVGQNYTFTPVAFADLPDVAGNATKISKVQELYDRYYDVATNAENGAAFQLALWEILYDPNNTNLSSGNFIATDPGGATSIGVAQSWLNVIGDSSIPDPSQRYILSGLYSPTGQDQIVPTQPVPGPAGVVLLAIGAVGLVARRKLFGMKKVEETTETSTEVQA
jgi:hypothetical protein